MTRIGAGWIKQNKNDEYYTSFTIDEALLPLTITKDKRLVALSNKNKTEEKQPDYYLDLFIPTEKNEG